MLLQPTPPTVLQRACFCQCGDSRTPPNTSVPSKLRGLTIQAKGVTPADGSAPTALKGLKPHALIQVLDYAVWDERRKSLAWGGRDPVATQAAVDADGGNTSCCGLLSQNCSRATHCTYVFYFADKPLGVGVATERAYTRADLKYASIVPWLNPLCCVPCLPAWCPVPWGAWGLDFTMEEHALSEDGRWWHRRSSLCGKAAGSKGAYELIRVLDQDGQPTTATIATTAPRPLDAWLAAGPKHLAMMR
jgi:hypothetical protein